jgi:polar amino acid transport system substrate-binding protein
VRRLEALGARVEQENDLPGSMRKVLAGRLDAYAELENMATNVLAQHPEDLRDIVKLTPPLRSEPYYLVLSKGFQARDPALAERIWNAIGEVARSPEYRELERKYAAAP